MFVLSWAWHARDQNLQQQQPVLFFFWIFYACHYTKILIFETKLALKNETTAKRKNIIITKNGTNILHTVLVQKKQCSFSFLWYFQYYWIIILMFYTHGKSEYKYFWQPFPDTTDVIYTMMIWLLYTLCLQGSRVCILRPAEADDERLQVRLMRSSYHRHKR